MKRSNPVNNVVAYATHIRFTGSPRSRCSLAMTKSTIPSSPLWRGCRAAAGWSENTRKSNTSVIASHHRWRSNPVNYARAYARLYYDWIATVAMLPRDDKKHHTQFPSVGGVPRSGGVVRVIKKMQHLCHCKHSVAIQ